MKSMDSSVIEPADIPIEQPDDDDNDQDAINDNESEGNDNDVDNDEDADINIDASSSTEMDNDVEKESEKLQLNESKPTKRRKNGRKRKNTSDATSNKKQSKSSNDSTATPGKKVSSQLLEKRRIGRIRAAEEFARKLKLTGIKRVNSTTIANQGLFQPLPLINQKNYSSDYLKRDDQIFTMRDRKEIRSNNNNNNGVVNNTATPEPQTLNDNENDNENENEDENVDLSDPSTTIIIHPGTRYFKIGFAQDQSPLVIPSCVAVPKSYYKDSNIDNFNPTFNYSKEQPEEFDTLREELFENFKERMRYYKRKVQSNGHDQVVSFNKNSKPEDINDPNSKNNDFFDNSDGTQKLYGEEALKCSEDNYVIRYPFTKGGSFNIDDPYYKSIQELISDISDIIVKVLTSSNFGLKKSEFNNYKVVLVLPDIFEKSHTETLIRLLLNELQFNAIALIQESLATCYGAGVSSPTCVVNIGATQIKIACVDEGSVIEDSIIRLDYGGDDITALFSILLLRSAFPYQEMNLNRSYDWALAERLKKNFVTFQDANVTVQLYNFIKRLPNKKPQKYDFETFEEVMLAPLALFFPEIFKLIQSSKKIESNNQQLKEQIPKSKDIYTNQPNDWKSISQADCVRNSLFSDTYDELKLLKDALSTYVNFDDTRDSITIEEEISKNYVSLEKAIVQSITNASASLDITKMPLFYSNILLAGGSSKIPSLDFILEDRIKMWRPRLLGVTSFPGFYKRITKQIRDLPNHNKTNKTEQEAKELTEAIDKLINDEFTTYTPTLEQQSNNDHYLPVSVLPAPRNMDPAELIWKGASVLGQIKLVEELFVTSADWDMHGSRILQHKCIFTY